MLYLDNRTVVNVQNFRFPRLSLFFICISVALRQGKYNIWPVGSMQLAIFLNYTMPLFLFYKHQKQEDLKGKTASQISLHHPKLCLYCVHCICA